MANDTHASDDRSVATLASVESAFGKSDAGADTSAPRWLQPLREKAFQTFCQTGFPGTRDEDWKYTNLSAFSERSAKYLQQPAVQKSAAGIHSIIDTLPEIENEIRVVFHNGLYRSDLSSTTRPDDGIELIPYSTADSSTGGKIFDDQPVDDNPMIALNTAFLADGLAIRITENATIDMPVHVVFASDGEPSASQPRLSIDAGKNTDALVIEHHVSTGESLTNAVTGIDCAEHARLFYIRLQNDSDQSMHVANQVARVAANAHLDSISIDFGSQLARNDLTVDLHGERAHANLYGLFMSNANRHVDNHLRVDHRALNTTSVENYRGILCDTARGVFNGKIIVHSGADGTDARMNNRNLLMHKRAEINTKPELEIYTDDVKCAHGSTTGQLDTNSMFYLRARGIPEKVARAMLVTAFAQQIIDHVRTKTPLLAAYLGNQVSAQLPETP